MVCTWTVFLLELFLIVISQLEDEVDYEDEGVSIAVPEGCSLGKIIDLEKPLRLVPYFFEEQYSGKLHSTTAVTMSL